MKNFINLFIGSALLLTSTFAFARVNVESINAQLKQKNATWVAKRSWVTDLSTADAKRLLGVSNMKKPEVASFRGLDKTQFMTSTDVMDWRNYQGQNWVGPVMDQGNCGSCVAFSTIATLEVQMNVSQKIPWLNKQYSPQGIFSCGGGGCNTGWQPDDSAAYLQKVGAPSEADEPDTMGATGKDVACSNICQNHPEQCQKIQSFSTPSSYGVNFDAVKAALHNGPLETTIFVFADFMSYGGGVYKHTTGDFLGGHAVSIVGYDDTKRAWIIRNSWGPTWGEGGFAYVSYDDQSGIADSTWAYTIGTDEGQVAFADLRDRAMIGGTHTFNVKSTYANTKSLTVIVGTASESCQGDACAVQIDTTKLTDGQYTATVQATLADGRMISSEAKSIYVLNNQGALTLNADLNPSGDAENAKGCQDKDISQPLSCRVVFNVSTESGAVPFSAVRFIAKDSSGKVVVDRTANTVLPGLTMGWRTNLLPNGQYEIYFIGYQNTDVKQNTVETKHITVTTQN